MVLVPVWLAAVYVLPPVLNDIVAIVGFVIGGRAYLHWARDPDEKNNQPPWGCFLVIRHNSLADEIEKAINVNPELLAHRERATLLRAAEAESQPEQELIRPAAKGSDATQGLLRASDLPETQQNPPQ
jgi:hypothetical protein